MDPEEIINEIELETYIGCLIKYKLTNVLTVPDLFLTNKDFT